MASVSNPRCLQTSHFENTFCIRVAYAWTLCENMTLSAKPELHHEPQCRHRRIKPQPYETVNMIIISHKIVQDVFRCMGNGRL